MTEEERAALKAEVVAEIGQQLGDHYFTKQQVTDLVVEVTQRVIVDEVIPILGELEDRVCDLEGAFVTRQLVKRVSANDREAYRAVSRTRGFYAARVEKRAAALFDGEAFHRSPPDIQKTLEPIRRLLGLDQPTDASRGK